MFLQLPPWRACPGAQVSKVSSTKTLPPTDMLSFSLSLPSCDDPETLEELDRIMSPVPGSSAVETPACTAGAVHARWNRTGRRRRPAWRDLGWTAKRWCQPALARENTGGAAAGGAVVSKNAGDMMKTKPGSRDRVRSEKDSLDPTWFDEGDGVSFESGALPLQHRSRTLAAPSAISEAVDGVFLFPMVTRGSMVDASSTGWPSSAGWRRRCIMGGRGAGPVGGSEHILAHENGRSVEGSNNCPAVQDVARSIVVICVEGSCPSDTWGHDGVVRAAGQSRIRADHRLLLFSGAIGGRDRLTIYRAVDLILRDVSGATRRHGPGNKGKVVVGGGGERGQDVGDVRRLVDENSGAMDVPYAHRAVAAEDEEIGRGRKDGEGRNTPDIYQDKCEVGMCFTERDGRR
ncbi:hypothetical protein B0H13DRAFT_1922779 [Mycena leptocephala]|nr:hypothetical protein B0H13DRAFT_1922779 [Mycena leptocephala]